MTTTAHPDARALRRGLLLLAAAVYAFNLFRYRGYLLDDTFISLRYAEQLVAGHGLVFNPGERVEGYTNFLLVMFAAGCIRVGIDPVVATKWLSFAAALWVIYLVARIERGAAQSSDARSWALCFLLPLQAFAYWSVCGMETMLFTALFLATLVAALRESHADAGHTSAVLAVLLALTRPEGALCFVLCSAALLIAEYLDRRTWSHLRRHAVNTCIFAAGFGSYFMWRCLYYGSVFPNTFYAKVTGGEGELLSGLQYFMTWFLTFPFLGSMLLFPVLGVVGPLRRSVVDRARLVIWAITFAYVGYVIVVGGDFMVFHRFFVPIMPLCALLLTWTLATLPSAWRGALITATCVASFAISLFTTQPEHAFVAHRTAVVGEAVGHWFAGVLQADDWIAINPAGALPYASGLPAVDMLGLVDETIARRPVFIVTPGWAGHRRGWGEYVLDRRPRVILWYNTAGAREPYYLGDHELAENPFFRFFYRLKSTTLPPVDGDGQSVAERFIGYPFGSTPSGVGRWGEMGLRGTFAETPLPLTTLYEAPIVVNYFEREARDDSLWSLKAESSGDPERFVAAVSAQWTMTVGDGGDPAARARVEAMCAEARRRIDAGDYATAGEVLADAARHNAQARSPLVYQYIANLAVLAGDLFTAVAAQKEALRLAPVNPLYRANLKRLLTVPYKEGTQPQEMRPQEVRPRMSVPPPPP